MSQQANENARDAWSRTQCNTNTVWPLVMAIMVLNFEYIN